MNKGTLDRPTFEAIEAYVLDRMPPEERAAFEQRLASDAVLHEEVELERENIRAVELGGLSRMLKDMAAEEQVDAPATRTWTDLLKYAAIIAAIVSGAIWWLGRAPLNEQLFAEHFAPDPGLPVAMGTTSDPAFADAMVAYKLGDYAEARMKWGPLLAQDPTNDTLRYYIASAWLAGGGTQEAIPLFEAMTRENNSAFQARAKWFLFLAYLHDNAIGKARAVDLDGDPTYGERVRAIKARLPG